MLKSITNAEIQLLIAQAIQAREQAYAPYSGFKVGSAVLSENAKIYPGHNIENVSYSLSICAERNALYHAHICGANTFYALAVVYHETEFAKPCGSCRQVMHEFNPELLLVLCNLRKEYRLLSLSKLLPEPFEKSQFQTHKIEAK
jgi:cytidine deaminase